MFVMSEILLFSDSHIHTHKKSYLRLCDCLTALNWVFETAKKRKIKDIVFGGDLFQDRQKIDVATYNLTFDVLAKHCDGSINLWLLLGNHDLWYYDKWDISSVLPFSALPGVSVISKPCTLEIANHQFDFIPYVRDPIDILKTLESSPAKVLIGHLAVHGAELNSLYHSLADVILEHDGDMVKVSTDLFKSWDKVFLGHYHGAQEMNNVEYIGSPLELNFGEAFQEKHLIIYNLKTLDKEYVINDFSPKHIICSETDFSKYDIKNNFIRLQVSNNASFDALELKKNIQKNGPSTLEVINKPKKDQSKVVEEAKSILNKEDDMLETFVKEVAPDNLDKIILTEIGKEICKDSILL